MTFFQELKRRASYRALTPFLAATLLAACAREEPVTETVAIEPAAAPAQAQEKSIAVLPFTDLSELGDQDYFSDGLSENLIDTLSMMPDLEVAGRDASFYYKDRNVVLSDVGAELGVAHILQGSVRKAGNQLRVSAQLVNASDGFNIWSRTFDSELAETFVITNEITDAVTTALSVTLGAGRFDIPGMTRNVDAFDTAMQAIATYNQFTPDSTFLALHLAEEAVRLDPQYGRAWVLLGSIYKDSPLILSADQSAEFPELANNAFEQARQVAPDMPDLMLVDARVQREAGKFGEAEQTYKNYFERNRNATARSMEEYAQLLSTTGRINESLIWLERAKSLEPFEPRYSFQLALHLLYADRIDEALAEADYDKTLEGSHWLAHSIGWQAALKQGDSAKAVELIQAYYTSFGDTADATVSQRFMNEVSAILLTNDFDASADDVIALIQSPSVTPVELSYLARLAAHLGQPEVALDYWYGENIGPAIWDSFYAEMRRLPDFKVLVQEKGLVDYWRTSGNWPDKCHPVDTDFVCD